MNKFRTVNFNKFFAEQYAAMAWAQQEAIDTAQYEACSRADPLHAPFGTLNRRGEMFHRFTADVALQASALRFEKRLEQWSISE